MPQQDSDTTRCSAQSQDTPAPSVDGLIAQLEQASGGDRRLDAEIYILRSLWKNAETLFVSSSRDSWGTIAIFRRTADACAAINWDFPHYTSSLDAAMTLVSEGWFWTVKHRAHPYQDRWPFESYISNGKMHGSGHWGDSGFADTAPLAVCIAALKVRQNMPQPERVSLGDTSNTDPSPQTTPAQSAES